MKVVDSVKECNMGILLSCIYTPPKDIIDPVVSENRICIITISAESEEVAALQSILEKHDIIGDDVKVHVIEDNCHKGRMSAYVEEISGGDELPFVTCNGEPLGAYSQIMAMADTGDLYKAIHGKEKEKEPEQNVKPERKTSVLGFFDGGNDKNKKKSTKKRKNTNTDASSVASSKK